MKNKIKFFGAMRSMAGIAVIIAVIGFSVNACDTGGSGDTQRQWSGKDVLGNSYTLSVGNGASRSAVKGDRFSMGLTGRDGKTPGREV